MKAIDYEVENASRSNWLDITGGTEVTLLDYFAGKALASAMLKRELDGESAERIADLSYGIAQEMLKIRAKIFTPTNVVRGVTGKTYG